MNYASWRLAFCFSKHKYAIHKSKAAYLRQIGGEIADKGKPMERLAEKVKQMFMLNKKEYIYLSLPNTPNNDLV